jgi:hypothetical protein
MQFTVWTDALACNAHVPRMLRKTGLSSRWPFDTTHRQRGVVSTEHVPGFSCGRSPGCGCGTRWYKRLLSLHASPIHWYPCCFAKLRGALRYIRTSQGLLFLLIFAEGYANCSSMQRVERTQLSRFSLSSASTSPCRFTGTWACRAWSTSPATSNR